MTANDIADFVIANFPGLNVVNAWGEKSFFYNPNNLLKRGQHLSLKLSGIDAKFGIWIQTIVYGSVTALLTYYVMFNKVSVGSVFSTYRYMFDFCNSLLGTPMIIISYINIKDVIKRLETENLAD